MGPKRPGSPTPIAAALEPLLERLDTGGQFTLIRLIRAWPAIAGETIARRTEVVSLRARTVVIKVSGAMWIQELQLMKSQILARVEGAIGARVIDDIHFIAGRLARRNPPRLKPVARTTRHAIDLPPVKDPELRLAFERLIESWGRAGR